MGKAIQPISDLSLSAVVHRLILFQLSSQVILMSADPFA